jgi:hypothetical protein
LPFLGYFFNEPTKSSLIGEKSPNLITLNYQQTIPAEKSILIEFLRRNTEKISSVETPRVKIPGKVNHNVAAL